MTMSVLILLKSKLKLSLVLRHKISKKTKRKDKSRIFRWHILDIVFFIWSSLVFSYSEFTATPEPNFEQQENRRQTSSPTYCVSKLIM